MTQANPHEFVGSMDRYRELSADNLQHLKKITEGRSDFVIPTRCLRADPAIDGRTIELQILPVTADEAGSEDHAARLNEQTIGRAFSLTRTGLSDLSDLIRLGVRHIDYQTTSRRTAEVCEYLNTCFQHDTMRQEVIVVRALEGEAFSSETTSGTVRAIVSTRYQRFDADDLLQHLLPRVQSGNLMLLKISLSRHGESCQIVLGDPHKAFEFKAQPGTHGQHLTAWPDSDDGLFLPGMSLSLSETGGGAVRIAPVLIKRMCVNGAIIGKWANRRIHVTNNRHTVGVAWRTDTVNAQRDASIKEMRDMIDHCMSDEIVDRFRECLNRSASKPVQANELKKTIAGKLEKGGAGKDVVENILALFSAQFSVLNGRSMYDAAQAITQFRDYDADPTVGPLLEEISGDLLLTA